MSYALETKLARLHAFWRRSNQDRPLVGFTGGYFPSDSIKVIRLAEREVEPRDIDVDAFLADCDAQFSAWRPYTGDLLWSASALWGFRWMSAIFGQPLHVSEETIWDEPCLPDYDHLEKLAFSLDNKWVGALLSITQRLAEHAEGRYCLGATLLTGPLASLAGLRGVTELALDLVDRPASVVAALKVVTEAWTQVCLQQLRLLPRYGGGYGQPARFLWAPGSLIEFDEDSSFLLSPNLHRRIVLPAHRELLASFDYAYLHLHSSQLRTLTDILQLRELPAIEVTVDVNSSVPDLIPALRQVQEHKPLVVHGYLTAEEIETIIEEVPPAGLCVIGRADTPDRAADLQERVLGSRGWL